jgi:uncharacterized protein YfiM (DUF2279 family)
MKSQARLRLRHIGKHHGNPHEWTRRFGVNAKLLEAFQRDAWPKHYADNSDAPQCYWQIASYVTGMAVWHGVVHLHNAAMPVMAYE